MACTSAGSLTFWAHPVAKSISETKKTPTRRTENLIFIIPSLLRLMDSGLKRAWRYNFRLVKFCRLFIPNLLQSNIYHRKNFGSSFLFLGPPSAGHSLLIISGAGPVLLPEQLWFQRHPGHALDNNGRHCGPIIQVDVFRGILCVVVAGPIDIVVFHEQNDRNADI
jgi:hypothetical protein